MPAAAKVCIKCKQDCSDRPRVKDAQGRYMCRQCMEAPPAPVEQAEGAIPLAVDEPGAADGLQVCPGCGSSMPHGSAICVQCGMDLKERRQIATDTSIPKPESAVPARQGKCGKCGYSLQGLKVPRCPECGTVVGRMSDRERRAKENAETVRWSYLKPAIQIVVGLGGSVLIHVLHGAASELPRYAAIFGIEVVIAEVVYVACCAVWMGMDTSLHLVLWRVLGVSAVVNLIAVVVALASLGVVLHGVIVVIAYVATLQSSLDLDFQDAVLVGIATYGIKLLATIFIFALMFAP